MIKAIVLDVDGVIVGDKEGVNFPLPNKLIVQKFIQLQNSGIPIVLCTAKYNHAVLSIIKIAKLHNPHITDGGALIINPLDHEIIKKFPILKKTVAACIETCRANNIYLEVYTPSKYIIQKNTVSHLTVLRERLLQQKPVIIGSLDQAVHEDVIKMIAFANDNRDMKRLENALQLFNTSLTAAWTNHPYIKPVRPLVLTAPKVSKEHALKLVLLHLGLTGGEVLGIGDSASDWMFMKHLTFAATVKNADPEIKKLIQTKAVGNYFIGNSVDDNGMLDILKYFSLI